MSMSTPAPNPANPANKTAEVRAERKRIPMWVPLRKLEVPEIAGFHMHWFLDSNVARAIQGGYEHVTEDEVPITQKGVGTDSTISGNTGLGSQISIVAGTGENGQPAHLHLMKIREDWWREDQKVLEQRNAAILSGIFRGEEIAGSDQTALGDRGVRYVKTAVLNRPTRKGI